MEWLDLTPGVVGILFIVATVAGFIDSIAGGGGLIVVPALIAAGLPAPQVLATSKLQSIGGAASASFYFIRRKAVNLSENKLSIVLTFLGAMVGTLLVQRVNADVLRLVLPVLIIAVGLFFMFSPAIGQKESSRRLAILPFVLILALIGFYDGFFGPGAGTFYALAFVLLQGMNMAKATAHAKVVNLTSNLAALIFFIIGGNVLWQLGLIMMVGQIIGGRIGASLVLTKGQKLIRPMIITMSLLMSCKLIYDNHSEQIIQWLSH